MENCEFPYISLYITKDEILREFRILKENNEVYITGTKADDITRIPVSGVDVLACELFQYRSIHNLGDNKCTIIDTNNSNLNIIADYFTEPVRVRTYFETLPSAYDFYQTNRERIHSCVRRELGGLPGVSESKMIECAREYIYSHHSEPKNFRPDVLKYLMSVYFAEGSGIRVLDTCAGYGDRLVACCASECVGSYVGVDPNPDLIEPFGRLIDWLNTEAGNTTDIEFISDSFEDANITGEFDLVLVGAPFYRKEIYNVKDPKQSIAGDPTLEEWLDRFMYPLIDKAWAHMKEGAYMFLFVNDYPQARYMRKIRRYLNKIANSLNMGVAFHANMNKSGSGRPSWIFLKRTIRNISPEIKQYKSSGHVLIMKETDSVFPLYRLLGLNILTQTSISPPLRKTVINGVTYLEDSLCLTGTLQRCFIEYIMDKTYNEYKVNDTSVGIYKISFAYACHLLEVPGKINIIKRLSAHAHVYNAEAFGSCEMVTNTTRGFSIQKKALHEYLDLDLGQIKPGSRIYLYDNDNIVTTYLKKMYPLCTIVQVDHITIRNCGIRKRTSDDKLREYIRIRTALRPGDVVLYTCEVY